jgi:threonine/homoserine/homoserine lactone efflux protein
MGNLSFLVLSYSLLAVPGPTNTLLATSAAGVGVSRSLHLLGAELCGYVGAIVVLRTVLGPTMADFPIVGLILRAAVTIYILCLAGMLWRRRSHELRDGPSVTFGHVLLTTLVNPKALIFAFLLLPLQVGLFELLPWLAVLAGQIVTAGAAWLALGATLGRGVRRLGHPDLINRLGAFALVAVAGLIWLHALGAPNG